MIRYSNIQMSKTIAKLLWWNAMQALKEQAKLGFLKKEKGEKAKKSAEEKGGPRARRSFARVVCSCRKVVRPNLRERQSLR